MMCYIASLLQHFCEYFAHRSECLGEKWHWLAGNSTNNFCASDTVQKAIIPAPPKTTLAVNTSNDAAHNTYFAKFRCVCDRQRAHSCGQPTLCSHTLSLSRSLPTTSRYIDLRRKKLALQVVTINYQRIVSDKLVAEVGFLGCLFRAKGICYGNTHTCI